MNEKEIGKIKYLGRMMGQNAWGNDDAEKIINWYIERLKEEMERNMQLEMENFRLLKKFPNSKWKSFISFINQ